MAEPTLILAGGFAIVSASIYAYVGTRFVRRQVSGESRLAARMFALWWMGLGVTTASGGLLALAGAFGTPSLGVVSASSYANIVIVSAALMGLLYYLVFLYTGRGEILLPMVAFYTAFGTTLALYIAASNPIGVRVSRWSVALTYEHPITGPFIILFLLLLIVPQIIAALAYFRLYFKLRERAQRFRVAVVSWSLIIWFGSSLLAAGAGVSQSDAWQVASRSLGLGAALAIFAAYYPPKWLKSRLGVAAAAH